MPTVETIRFRLREGMEDDDFLRRNHEVQTKYMEQRPGFISRETSRSEDGEWLVVVHWATAADAERTISEFFGAPETQEFLAAVDTGTVSAGRYEQVVYP